jgi:hypothetical protein
VGFIMKRMKELNASDTGAQGVRRVAQGLVVVGVAVCALAGCTSSEGVAAPLSRTPLTSSTTAPTPTVTTSGEPTSSPVTTSAAGPAVGPALAAAINDLSNKKRNVVSLDGARKQLQAGNVALGQARASITTIRTAVYGSTRNCATALAQNGIVRAKTSVAVNAANAVSSALVSRRAQLAALAQAATTVERQVTAQGSTIASMPDVRAAVALARSTITTESAATDQVNQSAVSLRTNAAQVSASGSQILAKTC